MNVCLANDSFPPLYDGVANTVINYARIIQERYGNAAVAVPRYPNVTDDYPFEVVRYGSIDTTRLVGYRAGVPFTAHGMRRLAEFMQLVKDEYGKYPLLYSQYRFYNDNLAPEFNKYFIFIARYSNKEPVLKGKGKYNIWQFSEKGRVAGIKGYVDLDRFANGTTIADIEL